MDILENKQGVFGYAHRDIDEAVQVIAELMFNNYTIILRIEIARRVLRKARISSMKICFESEIIKVAETMLTMGK